MEKQRNYLQRIQQIYPELRVHQSHFNNIGQNNDVLIVNDQLVFRFAKYRDGAENLETEVRWLEKIRDRVTLAIPNPQYQCFSVKEPGQAFVGYPMIQGDLLWRESLWKLDNPQIKAIAVQLEGFLTELHRLSVDEQSGEHTDPRQEMEDLYVRFQEKLFPFMREDARELVVERFETCFGNHLLFDFKPCLIHGDFGPSNILYDSVSKKITGIIDFGGAGVGDPAYDFAGLLSGYGEDFLQLFSVPGMDRMLERIKFYRSTFALQEALFGIENNDQEAFRNGIKDYL